jgi:transposase
MYRSLGYASELDFWTDLYVTRKHSIAELAERLDVSRNTIRSTLERLNVPIRKQGGPNNQKLAANDEIAEEIEKDGVSAVAKRLGLSYAAVYKRRCIVRKEASDADADASTSVDSEDDVE